MILRGSRKLGLMALLTLILFSCEEPSEIGLELKSDSQNIGVVYEDLELPAYVIYRDSLLTSSSARLFAGEYRNPEYGNIYAASYTQFGFGSSTLSIPGDAVYDSLVLSLTLDYTFGSGVNGFQNFSIHELQEDLSDTAAYYSFDQVDFDQEAIAEGTFRILEIQDSVLNFKFSDDFGNRLFQDVKDSTIIDPDDVMTLKNKYKGIALIPDENNNSIYRFNPLSNSSALYLYYHLNGDTVRYSYDFRFFDAANFNRIQPDWGGTPLQGVADQHYTEFTPSDNKLYLEAGTGLVTKVDLSPISQYFDTIQHVNFNSVTLELKINPLDGNEYSPSAIQFYYANSSNRRIRQGSDFLGIISDLTNDIARPEYNDSLRTYTATVTLFTDQFVHTEPTYSEVLIFPPEFGIGNSFNHFQIDPENIKVKIYYTKIR